MAAPPAADPLRERLEALLTRGRELEAEGLPFPSESIGRAVLELAAQGAHDQALQVLKRSESLYAVAARDWTWIKQSLDRRDELSALAASIGLDVEHLTQRVGDPRQQLRSAPLSAALLSRSAASASLAVAVLSDAIPKHCVAEAQKLGESIRAARDRGEDVRPVVEEFSKLLQAIQDQHPVAMSHALVAARTAVKRVPRAPSTAALPSDEEEEILVEARNLARRLQRIKSRAHNAKTAARLMTQVRAALSEDRRFGTPEEEIEELWSEVDRLTRERQRNADALDPFPDGEGLDPRPAGGANRGDEPVPAEDEPEPAVGAVTAGRPRTRARGGP